MPPSRRPVRFAAQHATSPPYSRANPHSSNDGARSTASVGHGANGRGPLRLTVKAPPSKLRQAISGSQVAAEVDPYVIDASESDAAPRAVSRAVRSTRNARPVIEADTDEDDEEVEEEPEEVANEQVNDDNDDDDEDDDDEEEDQDEDEDENGEDDDGSQDDDEDAEGEDEDEDVEMEADQRFINKLGMTKDSDEDAEAEDDDDDVDELTQDTHPPPPIIKQGHRHGKPSVTLALPNEGPLKSVEAKEMEDDEDDDELSELEEEEEEEEEGGAEGDEENDDEEMDDDDEDEGSRSATPDLSKLTRRQRAYYEDNENDDGGLMALSNEAQKKKHLTAEEHAMRRAEMARRRKNLSEKRNEEEKMDTINKLLKKPAPKRRTRQEIIAAQHAEALGTPGAEDGMREKPDPLFVRWTNSRAGSRLGVPEEWKDSPAGQVFQSGWKVTSRPAMILVEEVP